MRLETSTEMAREAGKLRKKDPLTGNETSTSRISLLPSQAIYEISQLRLQFHARKRDAAKKRGGSRRGEESKPIIFQ